MIKTNASSFPELRIRERESGELLSLMHEMNESLAAQKRPPVDKFTHEVALSIAGTTPESAARSILGSETPEMEYLGEGGSILFAKFGTQGVVARVSEVKVFVITLAA